MFQNDVKPADQFFIISRPEILLKKLIVEIELPASTTKLKLLPVII